jgi:tetratricopeptide (TPR) repeat protein
MDILKAALFLCVVTILLGLQSCAGTGKPVSPESPVPIPDPAEPAPRVPDRSPAQAVEQARKYADAGEYRKAIDIYSETYRLQPHDSSLTKEFARCLEGVRSIADEWLEKGDIAAAGGLYYILQNDYEKFEVIEQALSFDDAYLDTKLGFCKHTLTKQGFEEYRKGNIDTAIALWEGLLAIDPNNNDMKEAVRTATQQKKNLKKKN